MLVLPILVIGFYSFSLSVNIDILEFRSIIYTSIRKECFEMRVGQNIKTIAEAKRISIKELSRMVGIPYTTLYNMVNRNTDRFDLGLLEDIAHSLDVPIGALLESGELSLTEILGSHYSPSSNGALSKHRPPEHESEDSQDTGNHLPNNTETDNSIPFDIGDKRYDTLCNFDRLNALGKEVTIKLLLTIRAHQFDGDLRRQLIFLLKHSNNKAVYQLNQAPANLVFIDSFNDQYATPSSIELLKLLDQEID